MDDHHSTNEEIVLVADRLGHTRPSFTVDTYSHAQQYAQEEAVAVGNTLLIQLREQRQ